jgi:hypothetical protein
MRIALYVTDTSIRCLSLDFGRKLRLSDVLRIVSPLVVSRYMNLDVVVYRMALLRSRDNLRHSLVVLLGLVVGMLVFDTL